VPLGRIYAVQETCLPSCACLLALTVGCLPAPAESPRAAPTSSAAPATLLVEPDDGEAPVLAFIRGAQRALAIEMYLLTEGDAIQALIDAHTNGRVVQVILEPHPFGADGANQPAYDRLAAAGVDLAWASARFALTHAKLIVADGKRALVMSLNLTHAGLTTNREYAIADSDPIDVGDAVAIFAADRAGLPAPAPSRDGHLLASPANARVRLGDLIAGARRALAIEIEELSDPATVNAIVAAAARGVAVTVVLPGAERSAGTEAAAGRLAAAGASVRASSTLTIHAKAIVADGARLYVGSVNLTPASLDQNREFGLRLDDPGLATRVAATIAADWARAAEL
jgi:phosphatidylserine/phosphatidylglycerophosphate/cardiolipin synthase-like enzyme